MATTRAQINKFRPYTKKRSKHTLFFKRGMNKLYRQAWKQRRKMIFKHRYCGY